MMDEAQTYYDGLVAQGHAPDQALQYTQQHYPDFQPAAAAAPPPPRPAPPPAPGARRRSAPAPPRISSAKPPSAPSVTGTSATSSCSRAKDSLRRRRAYDNEWAVNALRTISAKLPGRMGGTRTTIRNLQVVRVDGERNLIFVKGGVPGARNGYVLISK